VVDRPRISDKSRTRASIDVRVEVAAFVSGVRPVFGRLVRVPDGSASNVATFLERCVGERLAVARRITMSAPIRVLAGTIYMLTRRTTQGQFLLRPDPEVNNAFLYCLIEAALRCGILLILPQMMSNHEHIAFKDVFARMPEFYGRFHAHFAKCINLIRGRSENMWSSAEPSRVELVEASDVMDKLVYIATNPVKDHLVDTVAHWPGPKTVAAFLERRTLKATRPRFFADDGDMPEEVEIELHVPEELGDPDVALAELARRIKAVEAEKAAERARSDRKIVGRQRILRQSWRDNANTYFPRGAINPTVAAKRKDARITRLAEKIWFRREYRRCYLLWRQGIDVVFPAGTYALRRFAGVEVADYVPIPVPID
jgi:hypothetical protein